MDRQDVFHTARLAGQVTRYHTWCMHQHQSVGEHTWQVMRIFLQVFGCLPSKVAEYLIWHDAGELVTGDVPFPLKMLNPGLKQHMDQLEHAAVEAMGGEHIWLNHEDAVRVKACECVEMHEHGRVEYLMGNKFAKPIMDDTWTAFLELPLSVDDFDKFALYIEKCWPALRGLEVHYDVGSRSKEHQLRIREGVDASGNKWELGD